MFAVHFEYAALDKYHNIPETPERKRAIGYGSYGEALTALTGFLRGKEYAIGKHFTALDLLFKQPVRLVNHARAGFISRGRSRRLYETPRRTPGLC